VVNNSVICTVVWLAVTHNTIVRVLIIGPLVHSTTRLVDRVHLKLIPLRASPLFYFSSSTAQYVYSLLYQQYV